MKSLPTALFTFGLVPAAAAQGTISQSNATYAMTALPAGPNATTVATTNFTTNPAVADTTSESWWYYRIAGDVRESAFNTAGGQLVQNWAGNLATLSWSNVDARGFAAVLEITAYSTGPTAGVATHRMTVTNTSAAPLTIDLFQYTDIDHCNSAGGDTAVANPTTNRMLITDSCTDRMEYYGFRPDHYQVTAYATLRGLLTDGAVTNLTDTGLPFGPADFTGAFQWQNRTLQPNQSLTVFAALAQNHSVCDGGAEAIEYGTGKPGTNGQSHWGPQRPYLGSTPQLTITSGLAGALPIVALSFSSASIPIPPIGHLNIGLSPLITFTVANFDGSGVSTTPFPVPNDASLCGGSVYMQAFFFDPGAANAPIAHTPGLQWVLGSL